MPTHSIKVYICTSVSLALNYFGCPGSFANQIKPNSSFLFQSFYLKFKHLFLKLLQVRGAFKNFANSKFEQNFQLQFQTFKLIRHKKVHIAYHDNSYVVTKKTPLTQRISNYIAVLLTRYTVDGISGALEIGLMFGLFSVPCIIARMALTPIAGEVIKF